MEPPQYGPRQARPRIIAAYEPYVRERLAAFPELSIPRLLREIRPLGYEGGRTALGDFVRAVRPVAVPGFEVRFETEPGQQAQVVDFAHFKVAFDHEPQQLRVAWLFSLVLGHSRYLWGRFCLHQDLQTLLRLHIEAFEHLGGAPREILYDRMKTAVLGEGEDEHIVYNRSLLALAGHYGFSPRGRARRTGPRPRARWSGPTATSARTSSWAGTLPISKISTPNCSAGWTRWLTHASMAPPDYKHGGYHCNRARPWMQPKPPNRS